MTNDERKEVKELVEKLQELENELSAKTGKKSNKDLNEVLEHIKNAGKIKKEKQNDIEVVPDFEETISFDNKYEYVEKIIKEAIDNIKINRRKIIDDLYTLLEYVEESDIKNVKKLIALDSDQIIRMKKIEKYY